MKDAFGNDLKIGDYIAQMESDEFLPKGSEWKVIEYGVERTSGQKICVIKDLRKSFIACAYQSELKYFKKVWKDN